MFCSAVFTYISEVYSSKKNGKKYSKIQENVAVILSKKDIAYY